MWWLVLLVAFPLGLVVGYALTVLVRPRRSGQAAAAEVRLVDKPIGPRPSLALVTAIQRGECRTCRHFDLAEGQAVIEHTSPVFAQVSRILTPYEMAKEKESVARKASWTDFGFCHHHKTTLYGLQTPEQRFRLPNDPTKEPLAVDLDCHALAPEEELMLRQPDWRIE